MMPFSSLWKKLGLTLVIAAFFSTTIAIGHNTDIAYADTPSASANIATQTERWLRFRGIYGCVYEKGFLATTDQKVAGGEIFGGGAETAIGYLNDNGKVSCDDGAFVKNSLNKIGFKTPAYAYCAAQPTSYRLSGPDTKDTNNFDGCINGSGLFNNGSNSHTIATEWLTGMKSQVTDYKTFMKDDGGQPDESKYYMYYQSLSKFCGAKQGILYTASEQQKSDVLGSKRKVVIDSVDSTGQKQSYIYSLTRDKTDKINDLYNNMGSDSDDFSCEKMAERTTQLSGAMATYVTNYNTLNPDAPQTDLGIIPGTSGAGPTCEVDGFGWVICPLITMMGNITDTVANFLGAYLETTPLITDSRSSDNALYKGWSNMVSVANILLVIAFLYLIFSQITSIGLSSYGVKKLLPRIVAAAILINLSYYIAAIAVDISNIVGANIGNLIYNSVGGATTDSQGGGLVGGIKKISGWTVALGAAGVGIVVIAFFFLIPAVIAILSIFVVVAARSAIITLLIIIAPLAFAAWVLPNTEKWFKKWWDLFLQMLLVYPAIMALFATATVASNIVVDSTALQSTNNPGPGNIFPLLIGLLIQALPLFALPALIKMSSGVLGRIDAMTKNHGVTKAASGALQGGRDRALRNAGARMAGNNWRDQSGVRGALGKGAAFAGGYKDRRDFKRKQQDETASRLQHEAVTEKILHNSGKNSFARSAAGTGIGGAAGRASSTSGQAAINRVLAGAVAAEEKAFNDHVAARVTFHTAQQTSFDSLKSEYTDALASGDSVNAVASLKQLGSLGSGGRKEVDNLIRSSSGIPIDNEELRKRIENTLTKDMYGSLVSSRGDVAKGGFISQKDIDDGKATPAQLNTWRVGNLKDLGTGQLASQDARTLSKNFGQITQAQAEAVMSSPQLSATISDESARRILEYKRANPTATTLPPSLQVS